MDENFRRVTWLEWPSTHQCTIQKILFRNFMDGMKLFPRGQFTWSAIFIFFWVLFFLLISFSQLTVFSPRPPFWFLFIFWPPLTPYYFLATLTHLSNLPTALPPVAMPPTFSSTLRFLLLSTSFPPFLRTSIPSVWETRTAWAFGFRVYLWASIWV